MPRSSRYRLLPGCRPQPRPQTVCCDPEAGQAFYSDFTQILLEFFVAFDELGDGKEKARLLEFHFEKEV